MTSAPQNPRSSKLSVKPRKLIVRLGEENTITPPTADDEIEFLRPIEIVRTAGGRQLDHAVFEWDLGKSNKRVQDLQIPTGWSRIVEILEDQSEGEDESYKLIFQGEISEQSLKIDSGESLTVIARVEPYHFGEPLVQYYVYNPVSESDLPIHEDTVFNPLMDGIIEGNKSSYEHQTYEYPLFAETDATRTAKARDDIQKLEPFYPVLWELKDIIKTVSTMLNPAETYIKNGDTEESVFDDPPKVENIRLKRGAYLPVYLDAILPPLGFDWYIGLEDDENGVGEKTIRFFKRADGVEKEVYFQRAGSDLDLKEQNVSEFTLDINIADLANEVELYGSLEQREMTIPLYRGWEETADGNSRNNLARSEGSNYATNQDAYRLLVANESGDYSQLRTTNHPIPATATDLSAEFSQAVPIRRRIEDCLTFTTNGRRRRPFVEWRPTSTGSWDEIPDTWSVALLTDQMGIRFIGDYPPSELFDNPEFEIRITGTVTGDVRINSLRTRLDSSPNSSTVKLVLDVSDRFHDRSVVRTGTYKSTLADESTDDPDRADEADDSTEIAEYAEKIQDIEESAAMRATIRIVGMNYSYTIGDLLTKVDGREISLNRNSKDASTKKYLQVTGIRHLVQEHITELLVEAAEDEIE